MPTINFTYARTDEQSTLETNASTILGLHLAVAMHFGGYSIWRPWGNGWVICDNPDEAVDPSVTNHLDDPPHCFQIPANQNQREQLSSQTVANA